MDVDKPQGPRRHTVAGIRGSDMDKLLMKEDDPDNPGRMRAHQRCKSSRQKNSTRSKRCFRLQAGH